MTDLAALCRSLPGARLRPEGAGAVRIEGLAYDSRRVRPGDLFFCIRGLKSDGRAFLPDAIRSGAAAAVLEGPDEAPALPAIYVDNVREAMPRIATAFHDFPSRRLRLVGVTGTNGKTTTTYLIRAIAGRAGLPTGVIGTVGIWIDDQELPAEHTTPEAPDLQEALARMVAAPGGSERVVAMEASSHALVQHRTGGCEFDVGVFTNLTQDHLDYHASMEEYFAAKALLFTRHPDSSEKPFSAVLNVDDPYGMRLAGMSRGRVLGFGRMGETSRPAGLDALLASDIRAGAARIQYRLHAPEGEFQVDLPIGGEFNVDNSLAAIGAARSLGLPWATILQALATAPGVPGRFESVPTGRDFSVIVDYAHTPDGLENVLRSARRLDPRRLIVVFGCGGDRDRTKRPRMGRIAASLADVAILTSDNPRSEDPEAILREIEVGARDGSAQVHSLVDRREAIRCGISLAGPGDTVVIAGKGHETSQIFAHETVHFDDREEARKALDAAHSG